MKSGLNLPPGCSATETDAACVNRFADPTTYVRNTYLGFSPCPRAGAVDGALLTPPLLVPSIVGRSAPVFGGSFAPCWAYSTFCLERGCHRPSDALRQRALHITREPAMQRFRGYPVADFNRRHVRREIG